MSFALLGRKKRVFDVIQLLNRENKIAAEFSHLFHLHGMCVIPDTARTFIYWLFFSSHYKWTCAVYVHQTLYIWVFQWSYTYEENIWWVCFTCFINSPQSNTQFQPKRWYSLSQIVLSYLVLMDTEGRQSSIAPYTSGLCGAVIGVSRHHYGSGCSISCAWWWSYHKKKEIYLSSQCQRWTRCCMKYRHVRCLIFPSLHPLILLQWRYAFIKRKRPKSFLAPKLGVGMPGLIWLNTLVLECAGLLVCMPLLMRSLSCCCSSSIFSVV